MIIIHIIYFKRASCLHQIYWSMFLGSYFDYYRFFSFFFFFQRITGQRDYWIWSVFMLMTLEWNQKQEKHALHNLHF